MADLLNFVEYGAEHGGTPLLIVHGLFGSARNWRAFGKHFSRSRRVVVVDMRNHGDSFWSDDQSYLDMAGDLAGVIDAIGGRADVLGHSMGGKAAMVLAVQQPENVDRLIVADIAPVGYGHSQLPLVDVMRELPLDQVKLRSEADALMAERVEEAAVRAFLLQSLELDGEGPRWSLNLDALAANMDAIIGFPALDGQFAGPVSFITGAASDYVRPEHHAAAQALFPAVTFQAIEGAGHWLHAEKPREFIAAVEVALRAAE